MTRPISEADLIDYMKNGAVKALRIVQTEQDKYQLVVNLTWKEGDYKVMTTRKTPREWVCLNRLVRHIKKEYDYKLPPIDLLLFSAKNFNEHLNDAQEKGT